jgi:branched-subunit amino acid transport protein
MATKKNAAKKLLPSAVYEILRWVTWIVLPAIATLISALNAAWGWNWPIDAILSTFAAVETFIGVVLGIAKYTNDKAN